MFTLLYINKQPRILHCPNKQMATQCTHPGGQRERPWWRRLSLLPASSMSTATRSRSQPQTSPPPPPTPPPSPPWRSCCRNLWPGAQGSKAPRVKWISGGLYFWTLNSFCKICTLNCSGNGQRWDLGMSPWAKSIGVSFFAKLQRIQVKNDLFQVWEGLRWSNGEGRAAAASTGCSSWLRI